MNMPNFNQMINESFMDEKPMEKLLEEVYRMGQKDVAENLSEFIASSIGVFIDQCGKMAEENWCPSQVDMLKRLFGAVLKGYKYADYEEDTEDG